MRTAWGLIGCVLVAVLGSSCDDGEGAEPVDAGPGSGGAGGSAGFGGDAGGKAGTGVGDGSTDGDGQLDACAVEQAALIAFVKANKGCNADTDCVFVAAESPVHEHCPPSDTSSGWFYLNKAHDQTELQKLAQALDACLPKLSPCNLSPFPAVCWHGQCAGDIDLGAKTQCLSNLGGESSCTKCACGPCDNACNGVLERPVVLCALKAGCLGTAECDPSSPEFPCKTEMAEAGGGAYKYCNECIADWQCATDCTGGK